jgi:ribonuclease HI
MLKIYIDGASSGNPGKSGIGYVIYRNGVRIKEASIYLGIQSNNFAEYMALIFTLSDMLDMGEKKCAVFSDSQLICEQITGNFKVKNKNIYPLFVLAKHLISKLESFTIEHIRREDNEEADRLAKEATGFLI